MTEKLRKELDAFELIMQDHREVECLIREFEYLKNNRMDTGRVIANACAELKLHDTLETEVFYAAIGEAADDEEVDRLLGDAEAEHDTMLELIEKIDQIRTDHKQRDAVFTDLAEQVKRHVAREEAEHFPLVKKLQRLDLDAVTAVMKSRRTELLAEVTIAKADEETV